MNIPLDIVYLNNPPRPLQWATADTDSSIKLISSNTIRTKPHIYSQYTAISFASSTEQAIMNPESTRIPANQLTLGRADLLVGTVYHSCGHSSKWILSYKPAIIPEAGPCARCCRAPATFACPICGHVHSDGVAEDASAATGPSCPGCNGHFVNESQLRVRRAALEVRGLRVVDLTAPLLLKYRIAEQTKLARKTAAELEQLRAAEQKNGVPGLYMPEGEGEEAF